MTLDILTKLFVQEKKKKLGGGGHSADCIRETCLNCFARMPTDLFKSLLSIDIIGLYPPFPIALKVPGATAPVSCADAIRTWRRHHIVRRRVGKSAKTKHRLQCTQHLKKQTNKQQTNTTKHRHKNDIKRTAAQNAEANRRRAE